MKSSIRAQLFIQVTAIILVCVSLTLILNSQLLSTVYIWQEKKSLRQVVEEIDALDFSTTESYQKIMDMERQDHFLIYIYEDGKGRYYPDFLNPAYTVEGGKTDWKSYLERVQESSRRFTVIKQYDAQKDGSYFQEETEDATGQEYLAYIALLEKHPGYSIHISAQKAPLVSNASVANNLIWRIATVTMLIACVIIYIYARKFTNPLIEMNRVTRKMAHMDFSQKCQVKRKDEIGELGDSINMLSDSLDQTWKDLQEKNKRLEQDIQRERKLDQVRKEFISNISHELKTPISIIQGYAEGLELGITVNSEDAKEYCDVIIEEAQRMNSMVMELLELSQYELGAYQLHQESFSIRDFAGELLHSHRLMFEEKQITVENAIDPAAIGFGDRSKLDMVLNNYLVNAIAHIDESRRIVISCEEKSDCWRVHVFNTGKPIDQEDIEKIWISFYRGDKSHNRSGNRYGLGLSIVRALQNLHGQKYGVENVTDGVSFWFDIAEPPAEKSTPDQRIQPERQDIQKERAEDGKAHDPPEEPAE